MRFSSTFAQIHRDIARLFVMAMLSAGALSTTGCVTLYQPQKGMQRPTVVPRRASNFQGLNILVRCNVHEEFMPQGDATTLCRQVATEFENQGANAQFSAPRDTDALEDDLFDGGVPDLTVDITSRIDHTNEYTSTSQVLAVLTLTLVPSIDERTFSQRVVIFGRDGSVLTEQVFRQRFIDYFGLGVWSLNWILDWFVRSEENAVSGGAAKENFSEDFYAQVRQMAYNGKVRSELLGITQRSSSQEQATRDDEKGEEKNQDTDGTGTSEAQTFDQLPGLIGEENEPVPYDDPDDAFDSLGSSDGEAP